MVRSVPLKFEVTTTRSVDSPIWMRSRGAASARGACSICGAGGCALSCAAADIASRPKARESAISRISQSPDRSQRIEIARPHEQVVGEPERNSQHQRRQQRTQLLAAQAL